MNEDTRSWNKETRTINDAILKAKANHGDIGKVVINALRQMSGSDKYPQLMRPLESKPMVEAVSLITKEVARYEERAKAKRNTGRSLAGTVYDRLHSEDFFAHAPVAVEGSTP